MMGHLWLPLMWYAEITNQTLERQRAACVTWLQEDNVIVKLAVHAVDSKRTSEL